MRGGTVQINWHDTKPVLTLDFHSPTGFLATGGADHVIKLWLITQSDMENKAPTASYQNCLSYHGSAVNVLRFSPSGEHLASGADGGELVIWKLHYGDDSITWKVLRFHRKDVLDLQWSTDGAFLVSGSVDNSCIIWDVNKDPLGQYVASNSSDRTRRIYVNKPNAKVKGHEKVNYVCQHVLTKVEHQKVDDSKPQSSKTHLFHDETLPSFFRRLAWSPDGSFLLAPAGTCKFSPASEIVNTAYVFSRKDLSRPALQLPGASKPIVVVRFCPVVFRLRGSSSAIFFKLPYRVVFALATLNSLYIYDTESVAPIAILAGLHYAVITDISWSADAKHLAVSSQDGYCTLLEFENDELGSPISSTEAKKVAEEKISPMLPKPENTVTMEIDRRTEASTDEGRQALPNPVRTSDPNKPC